MKATRSSETSVLTRPIRRHIPEDGILHSRRRENLKSTIVLLKPAALWIEGTRSHLRESSIPSQRTACHRAVISIIRGWKLFLPFILNSYFTLVSPIRQVPRRMEGNRSPTIKTLRIRLEDVKRRNKRTRNCVNKTERERERLTTLLNVIGN
jgi:hypothetical protein